MTPNEAPYSSMSALPGPAEDGKLVLRGRVKDANAVRGIHQTLEWADQQSSYNRTKVQAMVDGYPPLAPGDQRLTGNAGACNVNWLRGSQIIEEAKAPYPSLIQNTESLCTMPVKASFGDENERANWQPIIEEEWAIMVRSWEEFFPYFLQIVHQRTTHGVGVTFWEDEIDFRFKVAGLDTFKFPRHTKPFSNAISLCSCRCEIQPHEIWAKIRDPETAKETGWQVEACRQALMKAAPAVPAFTDWERWEEFWKNNDYMLSYGGAQPVVNGIYMWVKEVDGTVSHYLVDYQNPNTGFLFKKEGRFSSMQEQFVIFANGVGSNGTLHAVRGLGAAIYSMVLGDNRVYNKLQDLICLTATPLLEPPDEDSRLSAAIIPVGPINVLGTGWNYPKPEIPDYQNSLFPLVEMMGERMTSASARFTRSAPTLRSRQPRTKYAEQAEQEVLAGLSEGDLNLFMNPWTATMRNMVRRAIDKDYQTVDPGGHMVWEWRKRCKQRGVPLDAIYNIDVDRVQAVVPLGAGSPQKRSLTLEGLMPIIGQADQTGQQWFNRAFTIARADVPTADAIFPKTGPRTTLDESVAELQNNSLVQELQVPVLKDENHTVHAQVHLNRANELVSTLIPEGQMQPVQIANPLAALYSHGMEHLAILEKTNAQSPVTHQLKQGYQNLNGIVYNAQKELDNMMQEQAAMEAEAGGMSPDGQPPEQNFDAMAKVMEAQAKIYMQREAHAQKMIQSAETHQQQQALKDAETAASLLREQAKSLTKTAPK